MSQSRNILVIEDEQDISRVIKDYLTINGYKVEVADNGRKACD